LVHRNPLITLAFTCANPDAVDVVSSAMHSLHGEIAARAEPAAELAVVDGDFAKRRFADPLVGAELLDFVDKRRTGGLQMLGCPHCIPRLMGCVPTGQPSRWQNLPWQLCAMCGNNPTVGLPEEIRRRMLAQGYSARTLSLAAGVNYSFVRDILRGRSQNPKSEQLRRVAAVLGCTIEDLAGSVSLATKPTLSRRVAKLQALTTKLQTLSEKELDTVERLIDAVRAPRKNNAA
jgi:transcriptional regulator with XRE-family HTH domain